MATISTIDGVSIATIGTVEGVAKAGVSSVNSVSRSLTWSETWSGTLPTSVASQGGYSHRIVIPAGEITASGNTIRISVLAAAAASTVYSTVGFGQRVGTTGNTAETPVQVLWGGGTAGVTITANTTAVSDAFTFNLDESKDHLVIFDCAATSSGRYKVVAGARYYKVGATYNQATPTGLTADGYLKDITKIEVGT